MVRDPIEHFLSGWAEVAPGAKKERIELPNGNVRQKLHMNVSPKQLTDDQYDLRIQRYLDTCQRKLTVGQCAVNRWCPEVHSFPQANYLLTRDGSVAPQMEIVGDLRELGDTIRLTGFDFQSHIMGHRNHTADKVRSEFFPRRMDLLSVSTLRKLCSFVAIDYYLFDFEQPEACREVIAQAINGTKTWLDQKSLKLYRGSRKGKGSIRKLHWLDRVRKKMVPV